MRAKVSPLFSSEDLEILYRDPEILVINKPAGMLVHRGWGNDPVVAVDLVREWAGRKVHPIHRLDRGTSGPLLFALNPAMARWLGEAFDERTVDKRYLAFVRGITPEEGVIDHPIPRRKDGPRVPSVTHFRRLATFERYSVVEAIPKSGRLHQVRRHLKHISHPLIGDSNYGKREHNEIHRKRFSLTRLALHAWMLSFEHPDTKEVITCVASLPPSLREPFDRMGVPAQVWDDLYGGVTATPSPVPHAAPVAALEPTED